MVHLVVYEETEVVPLCRHLYVLLAGIFIILGRNEISYGFSHPVFVQVCMLVAVHAREEHVLNILIVFVISKYLISVRFVRALFLNL